MKRTLTSDPESSDAEDMLPEYHFDYRKARPNRFAAGSGSKRLTVVLDEDVAEVFTSSDAVNRALRALIEVVPTTASHKQR